MKRRYILQVILLAITVSSCSKVELNREQYDVILLDQFFKNAKDAQAAVTGMYRDFSQWGFTGVGDMLGIGWIGESMCDGVETLWGYDNFTRIQWTKSDDVATFQYERLVRSISKATTLIENLKNCPMADTTLKQRFISEVRGLRALAALYGYDLYGGLGMITDPLKLQDLNSDFYQKRLTRSEMADFIIKECSEIAEYLPNKYNKGDNDYGRMTKGMVLTVLMKTYMQEHRFSEAEAAARQIMTLGYSLTGPSYADIFTIENEQNDETIWSVGCVPDNEDALGNMWVVAVIPSDLPTQNPNQQAWDGWRLNWPYYEMFEPFDERLQVLLGQYTNKDGILIDRNSNELSKGAIPVKYGQDMGSSGVFSGIDVIVFRYADVLLSLAECINENNNGPTQEAIDLLMQIRDRAKASTKTLADFPSKDSFNLFLLDERGRELFMEGHRHMDLTRMGKYKEMVLLHKGIDMPDYMTVAPIPQNIVDQSKGVVAQNPGY